MYRDTVRTSSIAVGAPFARRSRQAMVLAQSDVIPDIFRNKMDLPPPLLRRGTDPPSPGPMLATRYDFSDTDSDGSAPRHQYHRSKTENNMMSMTGTTRKKGTTVHHYTLAAGDSLRSCTDTVKNDSSHLCDIAESSGMQERTNIRSLVDSTPRDSIMSRLSSSILKLPSFIKRTGSRGVSPS